MLLINANEKLILSHWLLLNMLSVRRKRLGRIDRVDRECNTFIDNHASIAIATKTTSDAASQQTVSDYFNNKHHKKLHPILPFADNVSFFLLLASHLPNNSTIVFQWYITSSSHNRYWMTKKTASKTDATQLILFQWKWTRNTSIMSDKLRDINKLCEIAVNIIKRIDKISKHLMLWNDNVSDSFVLLVSLLFILKHQKKKNELNDVESFNLKLTRLFNRYRQGFTLTFRWYRENKHNFWVFSNSSLPVWTNEELQRNHKITTALSD